MGISRADIIDADIVDAQELAATGTTSYRSGDSIVSTVSSTKVVTLSTTFGILYHDDPVESGDRVVLTGTTSADGIYTVDVILTDNTFTVVESIADSTGGTAAFRHKSGSTRVGVDSSGLTNSSATTLQDLIVDLDGAISSGGVTASQHRSLRQLIHFLDDGPGPGIYTAPSKDILPAGSPFPSTITWYSDNTKTVKFLRKTITRNSAQLPTTIVWEIFDTDGTTVLETVTDTITYTNAVFEVGRSRVYT